MMNETTSFVAPSKQENETLTLLNHYEQQYAAASAKIVTRIGQLPAITTIRERFVESSRIDTDIGEINDLLDLMELEIPSLRTPETKNKYELRVQMYQKELARLQADTRKAASSTDSPSDDRRELFSSFREAEDASAHLLQNNTDLLRDQNDRLDNGYRVCIETAEAGQSILADLHTQREQLTKSRGRLKESDRTMGQGSRTANAMLLSVQQNKLVMYGIFVVIVFVVVLVFYFIFRKHFM